MEWEHLKCNKLGNVAILTINNPNKMNNMNTNFTCEIQTAIDYCEKNREIRCVIITGAGNKAFSAGGDLKEEKSFNAKEVKEYNAQGRNIIMKILNSRIPYIASVNGYALGAAISLILACDLAISSDNAIYGIPTPSLGGIPGWGCTQVARAIGMKNAKFLLLANEKLNAEEAKNIGMVNKIVKQKDLDDVTMQYAERIASYAPNVMESIKFAINKGMDCSFDESLAMEANMLDNCNSEYNFKEGITAFLEKRKAKFKML
jgi:enoyl-CoA hydratase